MEFVRRLADLYRSRFDSLALRFGAAGVVGVLAIMNAGIIGLMGWLERSRCGDSRVSILDLELTFSSTRFDTLMKLIEPEACREFVRWHFITVDVAFPVLYALGLCAAFIWMERQRRFHANDTPTNDELPRRNHFFVVVPLAAGLFDIVAENIPLWGAATLLEAGVAAHSPLVSVLVWVGSLGAAAKWTLIVVSVLALLAEVVSCSRGTVLRRLRFSAIAVVLGALPLLLVPQGQEILLRVVEGEEVGARMATAIAALAFAAFTVWYCGRKLVQLRFRGDPHPEDGNWYQYYAQQTPRQLGIAVLALGGAAFARAAGALVWFAGAAILGYAAVYVTQRWWPALPRTIGKALTHGYWKLVEGLDRQIGRATIASLIALGVLVFAPGVSDPGERESILLRTTAWLMLVAAWVFHLYVYFRRGFMAARRTATAGRQYQFELRSAAAEAVSSMDANRLEKGIKRAVALGVLVSVAAVIVFTVWPVQSGRRLGALPLLALAVSSVVFYGSVAAWIYGRFRIPVVPSAIVFAIVFSMWNQNHVVRKLDAGGDLVRSRQTIAQRLDSWRPADTSSAPTAVILVAASGGGLRAAYWTATSLAALQHRNEAFNRHLFAISGVSGGSLGAAVYAAIVRDVEARDSSITCHVNESARRRSPATFGPYHECVRSFMGDDFLSPVVAKMVAPDFLQLFLPIPIRALDRSAGMEGSWEKSYSDMTRLPTMSEGFLALTGDSAAGAPSLFLNTTHVETGKRYVTASLVRGDSTPPPGSSSRAMLDSRDLLDIFQSDLPLSTAVHNSARFPFVSPPGRIQRNDSAEFGHVVDGGYFENSGLATLREVLDVIMSKRADAGGRRALLPVVLYLCNDPIPCSGGSLPDTVLPMKRGAITDWAGPIRALLATRDARGSLSRAAIADVDGIPFYQLNVCGSLVSEGSAADDTSGLLESKARRERAKQRIVSPPLGWLLSKAARDWMDASLSGDSTSGRPSACRRQNAAVLAKVDSLLKLGLAPVSQAQPTAGAGAATGTAPAESGGPEVPLLR